MTQRWKITVEYDGTDFVGWQRQNEGFSVQGVLEEAVFKLSGERVTLHVAGRTDAGVHALGQVAHFDLEKTFDAHAVRNALNVHARPHQVAVVKAEAADGEFHARFDAVRRHYRYTICNRWAPPVVGGRYMWHVAHPLDIEPMQKAANVLVGEKYDFSSFRAAECQAKHAIRSIDVLNVTRDGDLVHIDVSATSFLHHQVRNIVGTLRKIGDGAWPWEKMQEILDAKDRSVAGPTAPPTGLFFLRVDYKDSGSK